MLPTEGLVAWYPFNGNANDESGNGNDGTVQGAILVADRFDKTKHAYYFDGSNDYIDIGNPADIGLMYLTQCAWIKTSELPINDSVILTKRQDEGGSDWISVGINNAGLAQCIIDDAYYRTNAVGTTKLLDNSWHFIAGVKDQDSVRLYVDGKLEGEITDNHIMDGSMANMHIGHHGGWDVYYKGVIDDIRIYNRALSSSEIESLYSAGGFIPPLKRPMIAAYSVSKTSIKIRWQSIPEVKKYILEQSANITGPFKTLYTGSDTLYLHEGLSTQQVVWYRLKGTSQSRTSAWSDTISAQVGTFPTSGLVAFYPFNGNARDESGSNHHATSVGVTLTNDRYEKPNSAFSFNGRDNYLTVSNTTVGNLGDYATISLWFYATNANFDGDQHRILEKDYWSYWIFIIGANIMYFTVCENNREAYHKIILDQAEMSGKWVHMLVRKKLTIYEIYVNGYYRDTVVAPFTTLSTSAPLTMGRSNYWGSQYFHGKIDDIRIYNRDLTYSEILTLYHEGGWGE